MKTNELEIIGYSSEKKEIEKLKATLLRTDDYSDMGIRVPGGLVIYGPSGSGKTLLATSIESDEIKMYEITEADILSEDEFLIKGIFDDAKNSAPAIVLLDGLDKVLKSANKLLFNKRDSVNQIIKAAISELKNNDGILVVITSNSLNSVKDIVLDTGRFDRIVELKHPDDEHRKLIVKHVGYGYDCRHSIIRENDDEVMQLKDQINEITDNDYIVMLSAYMCTAEDGDEIIEALYEFVSNCKGFVEVDEEITQQVTKEEFEEVLSECEDKCALMSCIEESHTINVAEVPMYNKYREFGLRLKNNAINLFLPKIDINTDTKKFIGEELGIILYKLLSEKFTPEYLRHEMNRYIGESRNREEPTKELFKEYFYQVVLYKERKPGIYLEIDDHMRRIFVLEFFKRIIREYLEKQEGKSSAKNSRVFT